jgi:hypothetical protein
MQLITGNTYPVKDQLKALGARWNPENKGWMVPDEKAQVARDIVTGKSSTSTPRASAPGMASDKQRLTIRKMLRRVESIRMFDSVSGCGDQIAADIRREIETRGGLDKLTSRQASDFIGSLIGLADDEM